MADLPPEPSRFWPRLRKFVIGSGLLVGLLAALVWFAPVIVAKTSLKQTILAKATEGLNGSVDVSELSLGWLEPVELRSVTVTDASGQTTIQAARVSTSKTLLTLALDQADIGTLTIEQPVVNLVCQASSTNVEELLANLLKDDGSPAKPVRTGLVVHIVQGSVNITEAGQTGEKIVELADAMITMPVARTEPIVVKADATSPVAGNAEAGTLNVESSIGTIVTVDLKANNFAVGNLEPIVRRFVPDTRLAAQLTSDVHASIDRTTPEKMVLKVDGTTTVATLDLAGPWLGADRVQVQSLAITPCKLQLVGNELTVEQADLKWDAGMASVAGGLNLTDTPEQLLARPAIKLSADIDVAKLSAIVPKLLRLKAGTELQEGRLIASLESKAGAAGTDWQGSVTTTALRGTRDGKPLVWEKPLRVAFDGQLRADHTPIFHKLECAADFIGMAGRGSIDSFIVMANVDLDRLNTRLADFVDLGNTKLAGYAQVTVKNEPRAGGGSQGNVTAKVTNLKFADAQGRELNEPEMTITANLVGQVDPAGPIRIETADANIQAGADQLAAKLLQPIANAREIRTGQLHATLNGELARWRSRAAAWANIPPTWQIAGAGPVEATVTVNDDGITLDRVTGLLTNVDFVGAGVNLHEPKLKVETSATWSRKSNDVNLTNVVVHCDTLVYTTPKVEMRQAAGGYTIATNGDLTANMNRVQRTLMLQSDPQNKDAINGLAIGKVGVVVNGAAVQFDADVKVDQFLYGIPSRPTWQEPWVKLRVLGGYESDALRLQTIHVERDGFSVDGKGGLAKISTTQELELDGTLAYDLAKLEPTLKQYLGKGSSATGKDSRPFHIAGSLANGAQGLAVNVGNAAPSQNGALASLNGNAALSWQQLKAYGFEVGASEMKAGFERGIVTMNPIEANFGGGKVRVEPKLDLNTKGYNLTLAKGKIIDQARITPAVCANAVGYALPMFANAAQADGLLSFELEDNSIPLLDPEKGTVRGKLLLHNATVSPGPLVTQIAQLLGAKQLSHTLAKDQQVPVRLENGRVYHENFDVTIGRTVVRSSGSVGLDDTISITLDMPVPDKFLDKLGNNPRIRELLSKQRIQIPVTGTMSKPMLDPRGVEANVQTMIRNAAKDALIGGPGNGNGNGGGVAGDAAKKLEDKVRDELQKKLGSKFPFGGGQPNDPPKK